MAVAAGLAVGEVGCGGDDQGEGGAGGQVTSQSAGSGTSAGGDGQGAGGGRTDGPALSGDVGQARQGVAAVDGVYASLGAAVDAEVAASDLPAGETLKAAEDNESLAKACDLMSEEAKRQTVVYAEQSAGLAGVRWTCEKATGLLLRRASQAGGLERSLRAKVIGVNVEGERATASVRFGGGGPISTIPLVREDGKWKLAALPPGRGRR